MTTDDGRHDLRLLRVDAGEAAALGAAGLPAGRAAARGWPTGDTFALLQCAATGGHVWLVIDGAGRIVGECATKGPPGVTGVVEIGYALAPSARGRGLGRRAVAALLARLDRQPGVVAVEADVATGNVASRRVLEHTGFAVVGSEDTLLRYRRPTPVSRRPRRG